MEAKVYRMKIHHIMWWTLYIVFTRAFFASLLFIPIGIIAAIFYISFFVLFYPALFLLAIYILMQITKNIIYIKYDDSQLIIWSLIRRYRLKWDEVKSVEEIVRKPRFSGIAQGGYAGTGGAERRALSIKTQTRTFNIELSLYRSDRTFTESFYNSADIVRNVKSAWITNTRATI